MESHKIAFSAMVLSVGFFLMIGFVESYPFLGLAEDTSMVLTTLFQFLDRFDFIGRPLRSRNYLLLLILGSVMAYYPKKVPGKKFSTGFTVLGAGIMLLYFSSLITTPNKPRLLLYWLVYGIGFILSIWGVLHLFQVLGHKNMSSKDPFNTENETFLQMEERLNTPYSVNIPYHYTYGGILRKGWINFINLFRGLMIVGTPGSGKSFALVEEILNQFIQKQFSLLLYDFKFDTLSTIAYNYWLRECELHPDKTFPNFYVINFDDVTYSHRCNPLEPELIQNQMDASDAATVIMKNLNREWIKRNDFFSRSAISFVAGLIWYLKRKSEEYGKNYCTLPHVITLSTVNIEFLLQIMLEDPEVRQLMIPFKDALDRDAGQQLAGQTASAQISLSLLANKELYYVLTGHDFQLDINNPQDPSIVCIQNNPNRSEIYAAPIGLIINKTLQVINKPGGVPCGVLLDELPTVFIMGLRKIIDTGRSHLVATILGIQSISQLIADYGKELADVIFDNCANIFSGAAKGETAHRISEIFGRIHQQKEAHTLSKQDTSTNISTEMHDLLPKSKITGMSTGYFGGIVADTFDHPIHQKLCYGLLLPNLDAKKHQRQHPLPPIRSFKAENHEEQLREALEGLEELNFFDHLVKMDWTILESYEFYYHHVPTIAKATYDMEIQQLDFIYLIRDYRLYDHRFALREHFGSDGTSKLQLRSYLSKIIDSYLIRIEKDRVLSENFQAILDDIDELVSQEYLNLEGNPPEKAIFSTKTQTSQTADPTRKQEYNPLHTEPSEMQEVDLQDSFFNSREKVTFDINQELAEDVFTFAKRPISEPFSSFPVELIN